RAARTGSPHGKTSRDSSTPRARAFRPDRASKAQPARGTPLGGTISSRISYRAMPVHPVNSLDDPRVAPYRNLKDRELARQGGRFIAEGEHLIRRLLASDYKTESVLL